MKTVVAGANGKVGRYVIELLTERQQDVRAMVRDPEQRMPLEALGAEVVVADLEEDVSHAVSGCDAAIFTAGSGPNTGPEKTKDVDRDGAKRMIDTCGRAGVNRFLMVSSMHADFPEQGDKKIQHYLEAKQEADNHLRSSKLDYTIVRPGKLTQEISDGRVSVAERLGEHGEIPREAVANALVEALPLQNLNRRAFDVTTGETPIRRALAELES